MTFTPVIIHSGVPKRGKSRWNSLELSEHLRSGSNLCCGEQRTQHMSQHLCVNRLEQDRCPERSNVGQKGWSHKGRSANQQGKRSGFWMRFELPNRLGDLLLLCYIY